MSGPERVVACAAAGSARGVEAAAAAIAVAATAPEDESQGTILADLRPAARAPRGALLASSSARRLEASLSENPALRAAARGRLCFAAPLAAADDPPAALGGLLEADPGASLVLCLCDPGDFRSVLAQAPRAERAALIRAAPRADRSLLALLSAELRAMAVPLKVWSAPIGTIPGRRALAGLEPGGESGRRAVRLAAALAPPRGPRRSRRFLSALEAERAQALPAVLGIAVLVVALALILVAIGGAATAKGRLQRSADLAALSAARSMRDDFPRLFAAPLRADGTPNPAHLERSEYLERARLAATEAAERNGTKPQLVDVEFPDGSSMAPLRVRVAAEGQIELDGDDSPRASTAAEAEAEVTPPLAGASAPQPAMASGGGYAGPLAYRQGEGMRPDVAEAFDRMAAAAAGAGVSLVINSGFRSDAEQRELWEQNPDPRMVAPPGTSLHRCGTELDLGPPETYAWLAANAPRFSFTKRYSWEPWHFGFDGGPGPCSAAGDRVGSGAAADGRLAGEGGLPSFVPERYRRPLLESAARHGVSAALLAAQIMAESNFNPAAVSPAGALGIAQFMPATAAAYGLDDPFDPAAAIDAQATMMGELLARFGSVELALAAYNAGPGAVEACGCVPSYPETQAYVARILGMLDGAGALGTLPPPALEVRLVA